MSLQDLHDGRPTGTLALIEQNHKTALSSIEKDGKIYQLKQENSKLYKQLAFVSNELTVARTENNSLKEKIAELTAQKIIEALIPVARPYAVFRNTPTFDDVLTVVTGFYEVRPIDLKSARRTHDITWPRHVFMFLSYELTERSYPEIGKFLGGRDHTTALHGKRKIEAALAAGDERLRDEIDLLKIKIAELMATRNKAVKNG